MKLSFFDKRPAPWGLLAALLFLPFSNGIAAEIPLFKSSVAGTLQPKSELKLEPLSVQFAGAPDVEAKLRQKLSAAGYRIAEVTEQAKWRLRAEVTYFGPDSERPALGEAEINPPPVLIGEMINRFLFIFNPHPALATAFYLHPTSADRAIYVTDVVGKATGLTEWVDGLFKSRNRSPKPIGALIVTLQMEDGTQQTAQVLAQSFTEQATIEGLMENALDQIVWFF